MNLNAAEFRQSIMGRREAVIWKGLRAQCVAVIDDVATIIWKPGEMFERVPLSSIRLAQPGDEYIDHCDRIIVCKPSVELDTAWTNDGLRRGSWTAYIEGSRDGESGWPILEPDDPSADLWRAFAGTYQVSDQDVFVRNGGMSKTFIIYLRPKEHVMRLAQRALELWIPEVEQKQEREKDGKIRMLTQSNALLREEIERLWLRVGTALETGKALGRMEAKS